MNRPRCASGKCTGVAHHRGLCGAHYERWRKANPVVDPPVVRQHIQELRAEGMTWRRISILSGVSRRTLQDIRNRCSHYVWSTTAAKIMAVAPPRDALHAAPDLERIPALGTTRRLQALVAIGYTNAELSELIPYHYHHISNVILGRQAYVNAATARRVAELFTELQLMPRGDDYAAARARDRAAKRGWAPPMAWDDDTLDDPDGRPHGIAARRRTRSVPDDFADIVADHRALGRGDVDVADRLGLTLDAFHRRLGRMGIPQRAVAS